MSDTSDLLQSQSQSSRTTSPSPLPGVSASVAGTSGNGSRENSPSPAPDFDFIQSPLKRQYFRDNLVQVHTEAQTPTKTQNRSEIMTPSDEAADFGGDASTKREVVATFTSPAPVISYDHGVKAQLITPTQSAPGHVISNVTRTEDANSNSTGKGKGTTALDAKFVRDERESPYQPTTTPLYTKSQFSSIEKFIGSSTTGSGSGVSTQDPEKGNAPEYKIQYIPDDNVKEALLAFLLSAFNLFFSAGIGYWHLSAGLNDAGYKTFAILIIGGSLMKLAFIFNRDIKVWNECKPIFLLAIIPLFTAFSLSFADLIFTVKVSKNKNYVRPWTNTRMVYLVESLMLAFPQCVYQSILMVEDPFSLITVKGMIVLIGLGILVYSMAFARIRYDTTYRPHRFGSGIDKILRSVIIGSHKGLWVVTYVCALAAARMQFSTTPTLTMLVTIGILLLSMELPILISTFRLFESLVVKYSWMFFMIPQFVFLVALIFWVNVDPGLYDTNVGVCLLGAASMFESIVLMGWLLDTCTDRDSDVMAVYPHFLGDLWNRNDRRKL